MNESEQDWKNVMRYAEAHMEMTIEQTLQWKLREIVLAVNNVGELLAAGRDA